MGGGHASHKTNGPKKITASFIYILVQNYPSPLQNSKFFEPPSEISKPTPLEFLYK